MTHQRILCSSTPAKRLAPGLLQGGQTGRAAEEGTERCGDLWPQDALAIAVAGLWALSLAPQPTSPAES